MKKKISIILILICLILVGVLLIYRNDKENVEMQNNQITSENEIQYQDNEENIIENINQRSFCGESLIFRKVTINNYLFNF